MSSQRALVVNPFRPFLWGIHTLLVKMEVRVASLIERASTHSCHSPHAANGQSAHQPA